MEDMRNRIQSMEEKQIHIETSQETILQTQHQILCRLDVIERALRSQTHSTPYQYMQRGLMMTTTVFMLIIIRPTTPVSPLPTHRPVLPLLTHRPASTLLTHRPASPLRTRQTTKTASPLLICPPTKTAPTPTTQHSLDSPEPFPIKFIGNSLSSSVIETTELQSVRVHFTQIPQTSVRVQARDTSCQVQARDTSCQVQARDTSCQVQARDTSCQVQARDTSCQAGESSHLRGQGPDPVYRDG